MKNIKIIKTIEYLEKHRISSVSELAQNLKCSEMTIRRYLTELESSGLIVRAHGCAYLTPEAKPTVFEEQMNIYSRQKFLICHEATKMIKENSTVCFDSGTTILRMVELMDRYTNFTAFTTFLPLAQKLAKFDNVQIILPEGNLNKNNLTLELTNKSLVNNFKADISFISCRTLRLPLGTFEHSQSLIPTKQWLAKAGKKTVLLLDSSKWQKESVDLCISLKDIDVIITDYNLPQNLQNYALSLGKELIIAKE